MFERKPKWPSFAFWATPVLFLLVALSCQSCSMFDVETDSEEITRLVSEFEPPMLSILQDMKEEQYAVDRWIPTFQQAGTTVIHVEELRGLVPMLERYSATADTLTRARLGGFIAGLKIELEMD